MTGVCDCVWVPRENPSVPTTNQNFLLWGASANHYMTVLPPRCKEEQKLKAHNVWSPVDEVFSMFKPVKTQMAHPAQMEKLEDFPIESI